jgi:protein-S-isoprenylcysteine O-methyltransferase Ste14
MTSSTFSLPTAASDSRRKATSVAEIEAVPPPASLAARLTILALGSLIYLLFLGTFGYAMGFVTGLVAPTSVDGGLPAPLGEALLVNGGLLGLFAAQHTIMARRAFKARWTRIVPKPIERSLFVLATCAILIALFVQWRSMPGVVWQVGGPASIALWTLCGLGWTTVLLSTFLIDHFELFGLRQAVLAGLGRPYREPRFVERALYKVVRHPLMLGFLFAFWCTPTMTVGHLFFAVMTTGYILFGIRVEERTLIAAHGERYRDYRRRVPMLLPIPRRPA